ncbi:hypothetical protein [Pseudomonas aestuarii]
MLIHLVDAAVSGGCLEAEPARMAWWLTEAGTQYKSM